jgi:hypothetical protein
MSSTITLKGIPENVYAELKSSAEANRRSINSEAWMRITGTQQKR